MLVCDFIVEQLVRSGVTAFFVLTGGAIAPLVDAISRNDRASLYCFQHEQSASMAVDAYYRVAGRMACVAVTSGPGAQNVLNGLCGCYFDSVPAIFITGQVNTRESLDSVRASPRQVGFQETAVVASFAPFTKFCAKANSAAEIPALLLRALRAAQAGRGGPSVLDLPVDLQMSGLDADVAYGLLDEPAPGPVAAAEAFRNAAATDLAFAEPGAGGAASPTAAGATTASAAASVSAAAALRHASRPLVVLGQGARSSVDTVRAFLESSGLPFVVTWAALDLFPHSHPLRVGAFGVYGSRVANLAVQNADLLVVLGARLDTRQTGGRLSSFSTQSVKIVCDIDSEEMQRLEERGVPIAFKFAMDVGSFLTAHMPPSLAELAPALGPWKGTLARWAAAFGSELRPDFDGHVNPYALFDNLNVDLPDDAVVVVDTGATLCWAFQSLKPRGSQRIFSNLGNRYGRGGGGGGVITFHLFCWTLTSVSDHLLCSRQLHGLRPPCCDRGGHRGP